MSIVNAVVTRLGRGASVALLIGAIWSVALIVAGFLAPMYESQSTSSSGEVRHGSGTLVGVNGLGVVVVLAVPLLVTLAVGSALWGSRQGKPWRSRGLSPGYWPDSPCWRCSRSGCSSFRQPSPC